MQVDAVNRVKDNRLLDHLASILVDVQQDSSSIVDSIISQHLCDLLELVFNWRCSKSKEDYPHHCHQNHAISESPEQTGRSLYQQLEIWGMRDIIRLVNDVKKNLTASQPNLDLLCELVEVESQNKAVHISV
jgi:hypothetical protein